MNEKHSSLISRIIKTNSGVIGLGILLSSIAIALGYGCHYLEIELDLSLLYWSCLISIYIFLVLPVLIYMCASLGSIKEYPDHAPKTEFLIIIPAYNESKVISNSVNSLLKQDYPRELFQVVVSFNGTDNTNEIARDLGAIVTETRHPGVGKHNAILHAMSMMSTENDQRYFVIVDADNIVDSFFLKKMNDAISATGAQCLQGWHRVLNGETSFVSKALYISYSASSRLYNWGRDRLLKNALICGTGWACHASLMKKYMPLIKTQTEDIELNGLLMCHENIGVRWVPGAFFYDEKPNDIWVAVQQRRRWMAGHLRTLRYLFWPCIKKAFTKRSITSLELAVYYCAPVIMSLSFIQGLILLVSILGTEIRIAHAPYALGLQIITLFYIFGYQILGFGLETKEWRKAPLYSIYSALFSLCVWNMALFLSWFMIRRNDWIFHTPHAMAQEEIVRGLNTQIQIHENYQPTNQKDVEKIVS